MILRGEIMNNQIKIISKNKIHVTFSYKQELYSFFLWGRNFSDKEANSEAFSEFRIQYPEFFL